MVGRIHGFEYVRKSPLHFREVCVGVVGESSNSPWVKGEVSRLLRSTRHLGRKYLGGGVVGLVFLWE